MTNQAPDISGMETQEARDRAFAEAFEAMREALIDATAWLPIGGKIAQKTSAALALADKVRG